MDARHDFTASFNAIHRLPTQKFIGLTGGIGSGKSAVGAAIREHGYTVLSADDIGRTITQTDDDVKASIRAAFGDVYQSNGDGLLDRARMAALVFGDTPQQQKNLEKLNSIVHPAVWRAVAREAEVHFAHGERFVFNETALLFETGANVWYDSVVVVDASEAVRLQRLQDGRGITEAEARRRLAAQMPAEEKRKRASYVIDNNGSLGNLRLEVGALLDALNATVETSVRQEDKSAQR